MDEAWTKLEGDRICNKCIEREKKREKKKEKKKKRERKKREKKKCIEISHGQEKRFSLFEIRSEA